MRSHPTGASLPTVGCGANPNTALRMSSRWQRIQPSGAWGWAATTNADGLLRTVVSTVHGLVADPLDPSFEGTEALSLTYQGPSRMISLHRVEIVSEPAE